jgi:hypothetical protein
MEPIIEQLEISQEIEEENSLEEPSDLDDNKLELQMRIYQNLMLLMRDLNEEIHLYDADD